MPADLATGGVRFFSRFRHSCAVLFDGTVRCWGKDGSLEQTVPSGLAGVQAVSTGSSHTCALYSNQTASGKVMCWGQSPQIDVPADLPPAKAVEATARFTCALLVGGTVRCWGDSTPVPALSNVIALRGGTDGHICAVVRQQAGSMQRSLQCWGINDYGQCTVPANLPDVVDVVAGQYHTCALLADGSVRCWGWSTPSAVPADLTPAGVQAVAIASANGHNCALLSTGAFRCWGAFSGANPTGTGPAC